MKSEHIPTNDKEQTDARERHWPTWVKVTAGIGGAATLFAGAAIVGGFKGAIAGWDRVGVISKTTEVSGGESELKDFDPEFNELCVTSAVMGFKGATNREGLAVLGKEVAWSETKVDADFEENQCIAAGSVTEKVDADGHLTLDIKNKDMITSRLTLMPETVVAHPDFSSGFAQYKNLVNLGKSTWGVQRLDFVKGIQDKDDTATSEQQATATIIGMHNAYSQCKEATEALAKPSVEQAVIDQYALGRGVESRRNSNINPLDTSVTIEGQPFSEETAFGDITNLDEAYGEIVKMAKKDDKFTIKDGKMGECKIPDEFKPKTPNQEGAN